MRFIFLAFVAFEGLLYGMAMDQERPRTPETESREQ